MDTSTATAIFSAFLLFYCLIGIVALLGLAFWIWTIVDSATNEPSGGNDKLVWLLIIIFTGVIGSLVYYFVRRPERLRMFGR